MKKNMASNPKEKKNYRLTILKIGRKMITMKMMKKKNVRLLIEASQFI